MKISTCAYGQSKAEEESFRQQKSFPHFQMHQRAAQKTGMANKGPK